MNELKCLTLEEFIFEKQKRIGKLMNEQEKKEDSDFLSKKPDETIGDLAITSKAKDILGDLVEMINKVYKSDVVDSTLSEVKPSSISGGSIKFKNKSELRFINLNKSPEEMNKQISNLKMSEFLQQCPCTITDKKGNSKTAFLGQLFAPKVITNSGPDIEYIDTGSISISSNHAKLGIQNIKNIGGFEVLVGYDK